MFAKVKFQVVGGLYQDFFNSLVDRGCDLTNVESTEFGFSACCPASEYKKLAKKGRKFQCRVRIVKKYGLYFKVRGLLRRKGLAAGGVASFLLIILFNNMVWRVNINTSDDALKSAVANVLYENGISAGTIYTKDNFVLALNNVRTDSRDIGYAALNFYRGTLNCEIYMRKKIEPYLRDSHEGDIIATESGIITDLRVYDGRGEVKLNQAVTKGELLVSAVNPITLKYTPTRAYIAALCSKEYSVYVPYVKTAQVYTGRVFEEKFLFFMGREFKIKDFEDKNSGAYETVTKIEYLRPLGFCLPFTVKTIKYIQMQDIEIEQDFLTAQQSAKDSIERIIRADGKLIEENSREYSYDITDEGVQVKCVIDCIYDIT